MYQFLLSFLPCLLAWGHIKIKIEKGKYMLNLKGTPGELTSGDMLIKVEFKKIEKNTWLFCFVLFCFIGVDLQSGGKSDILKS